MVDGFAGADVFEFQKHVESAFSWAERFETFVYETDSFRFEVENFLVEKSDEVFPVRFVAGFEGVEFAGGYRGGEEGYAIDDWVDFFGFSSYSF